MDDAVVQKNTGRVNKLVLTNGQQKMRKEWTMQWYRKILEESTNLC